MATYILTTGISGNSGIAKAVLESANLIAQVDKVYIVTVIKNFDGFAFSTPSINIDMHKNVEIISLKNKKIQYENSLVDKFKVKLVAREPLFKAGFNAYDYEVFRKFAESVTENDNVIFASFFVAKAFVEAGAKFPCKTIGQVHANFYDDVFNRNNLLASLEIIDTIQVIASDMVPYLSKITGFSEERFVYISNIVNPKSSNRGITNDDVIKVGIIGSYQKRKNQLFAIKIFEKLKKYPIELQIFGGTNGKYFEQCEQYIKDKKLNNVKIMGVKSELEIFENIDIVFAASTNEGQNLTLLEGLAYGKPLIATNFEYGPFDMIIPDKNGLLLETRRPRKAAKQIAKFCDFKTNENTLVSKSEQSANLFDQKFQAKKLLEKYENVLQTVGDFEHNNPFLYNNVLEEAKFLTVEENENYVIVNLPEKGLDITCLETYKTYFEVDEAKTQIKIDRTKQQQNLTIYVEKDNAKEYLFTFNKESLVTQNFYYYDNMIDTLKINVPRISLFENFVGITYPLNKVPTRVVSNNEKVIYNIRTLEKNNYMIPFIYIENNYDKIEIFYLDGSSENVKLN